MTQGKRWPKNVNDARVDSLTQAKLIYRTVQPIIDQLDHRRPVDPMELVLRMHRVSDAAQKIVFNLQVTAPLEFKKAGEE